MKFDIGCLIQLHVAYLLSHFGLAIKPCFTIQRLLVSNKLHCYKLISSVQTIAKCSLILYMKS